MSQEASEADNSFAEVAAADAAFRATEEAAGFDDDQEASALRRLFEGESFATE